MVTALDPEQIVSFEELPISQVIHQEALTRLLAEKGIFAKEDLDQSYLALINNFRATVAKFCCSTIASE